MKLVAVAAMTFSLLASNASAQPRHDITNMTCAQVQALIATEGAAILTYSSRRILGLPIYDRYVGGQKECAAGEVAGLTGVPTADMRYCPVRKCVASDLFIAR